MLLILSSKLGGTTNIDPIIDIDDVGQNGIKFKIILI